MIKLNCGNTNTFFIQGSSGGLLVDTDYAGLLQAFYKEIKKNNIKIEDINYILVTHYHPDHMGLVGNLMELGVKLLLIKEQKEYVHFSDSIFERDKFPYVPIKEEMATVISTKESRDFLGNIGISGEIINTPSHSADSVSLILDNGECFVGDLEPFEFLKAYKNKQTLKDDWNKLLSFKPKKIFYAHVNEKIIY